MSARYQTNAGLSASRTLEGFGQSQCFDHTQPLGNGSISECLPAYRIFWPGLEKDKGVVCGQAPGFFGGKNGVIKLEPV